MPNCTEQGMACTLSGSRCKTHKGEAHASCKCNTSTKRCNKNKEFAKSTPASKGEHSKPKPKKTSNCTEQGMACTLSGTNRCKVHKGEAHASCKCNTSTKRCNKNKESAKSTPASKGEHSKPKPRGSSASSKGKSPLNKKTPIVNELEVFGKAVRSGNVDKVREMLNNNSRLAITMVNVRGGRYDKPLVLAAYGGHLEIVKLLLRNGAKKPSEINYGEGGSGSALFWAVSMGNFEIVKLLLDAGADPNTFLDNYSTPLMTTAVHGYFEIAKILLNKGAHIDEMCDGEGYTPLMLAARYGHLNIVKLLISKGADKNKGGCKYFQELDDTDIPPLVLAAQYGHYSVVEFLLKSGADINKADSDGMTPLEGARQFGHDRVADLILKSSSSRKTGFGKGKKPQKRPSSAVCTRAQKLGVRLTLKRNNKRVYKSEEMLRAQIKNAVNKRKQKK
jgi:ankyrin repeat protein